MYRIGIIGTGGIARAHIDGWNLLPDRCRITAVNDIDAGRAQEAATRAGGARVYESYTALLADPELDAVDICLPHHLHAEAIIAAARAHKHVLIEKPLCITVAEAAAIRAEVQESGITLMCAHNQLFEPALEEARRLLTEGALGEVYMARTNDCFRADRTAEQWNWRRTLDTMGGGWLLDTGYHPTYTLLYLLGLVGQRPTQVTAMLGRHRQTVLEGEDTAQVLVRFSGGAIGNIHTSWAYELPLGNQSFHVVGANGQLAGRKSTLLYQPTNGEVQTFSSELVNSYHTQLPHFLDSIEQHSRPIQNEDDGIDVLNLILSAYESDRAGRTVPFPTAGA